MGVARIIFGGGDTFSKKIFKKLSKNIQKIFKKYSKNIQKKFQNFFEYFEKILKKIAKNALF